MSALAMAHESKGGSAQAARKAAGNLRINQPDDAFEQEADRVAEEILAGPRRRPAWSLSRVSMGPPLQRQCACGGKCEDCKQEKVVQRQASGGPAPAIAPAIVDRVLEAHGQPLDRATREFFEPRFGCDFSKVRIHADAEAEQSAAELGARAFTFGDRIAFAGGQYAPGTKAGRRLIAHELAHVTQQRSDPQRRI